MSYQTDLPDGNEHGVLPSSRALGFTKNYPAPLQPMSNAPAQNVALARSHVSSRFSTNVFPIDNEQRLVVGQSGRRNLLTIQNIGGADVWLGFGSQVAVGYGIYLPVNASMTYSIVVPQNEVYAICATGSILAIVQGNDE